MSNGMVQDYILLRLLVGFLGEKSQCTWWDSNFLSETGLQFLAINFPRTALAAGCTSVTAAAKRLHDDRIGKGGVYHLFRLPAAVEESLHRELLSAEPDKLEADINTKEKALSRLKSFSESAVDAPSGPVQIGTEDKILTKFAVSELAMHYCDAFTKGKMTFPYFGEKKA